MGTGFFCSSATASDVSAKEEVKGTQLGGCAGLGGGISHIHSVGHSPEAWLDSWSRWGLVGKLGVGCDVGGAEAMETQPSMD